MVSKATDLPLVIEIVYESGWGGNRYIQYFLAFSIEFRYEASSVASGIKKRYQKASIKLTPGGCGSFFEIYLGKDDKK